MSDSAVGYIKLSPADFNIDQMVHALDTPSVIPYDPSVAPNSPFAPSANSYHAAMDPAQKNTLSPNSPNLTVVKPDYGFRAGTTSFETLIGGTDPTAAPAAAPKTKPSTLLVYAALGVLAFYGFKNFKKQSKRK